MNQPQLLEQGLELMLYGMGTVVVFLSLLVLATTLMSRVVARLSPAPVAAETAAGATPDELTVAVISAAIHAHRARHKP